jgi:hypothetical protein
MRCCFVLRYRSWSAGRPAPSSSATSRAAPRPIVVRKMVQSLNVTHRNARGERRDQGRALSPMTYRAHVLGMPVDGTLARGTLGLEIGGDWMSASRPLSAGFVATTMRRSSTNAPQRAGRGAMEGRDERAGVKMAVIRSRSIFAHRCARRRSTAQRPRRTTRPGTRTLVGTCGRLRSRPRHAARQRTRRQRAGASQGEVAMRRPAVKRALSVRHQPREP